jgi:hypothetical protein
MPGFSLQGRVADCVVPCPVAGDVKPDGTKVPSAVARNSLKKFSHNNGRMQNSEIIWPRTIL